MEKRYQQNRTGEPRGCFLAPFYTDVLASEGVARQQPRVLAQLLHRDAEEVRSAALWHLNVHLHDVLSLWQRNRDSPFDS